MKKCDAHPEYEGKRQPRVQCEICWSIRKKAVGCLQADQERDDLYIAQGLGRSKISTLIKVPFAGGGPLM